MGSQTASNGSAAAFRQVQQRRARLSRVRAARDRRSGSVLLICIMVVFVTTMFGVILADESAKNQRFAIYDWNREQATQAADAGLDYMLWYVENSSTNHSTLPTSGHPVTHSETLPNSGASMSVTVSTISGHTNDYQVDSTGTMSSETTTVHAVVVITSQNVNAWTNAIFAGQSQSTSHGFFGNSTVAGSVHILDQDITDPTTQILSGNGGGGVYNNYVDAGGSTASGGFPGTSVPSTQVTPGTGSPSDLQAKFRVRIGVVNSGQKAFGSTATTPNKGNLAGFLSGYAPNATGAATYTGGKTIYADQIGAYDLGQNEVNFPDVVNPCTFNGVTYADYFAFLNANSGNTNTENCLQYSGNLVATNTTTFAQQSDNHGNSIQCTNGVLTVTGIIWVQGSIDLENVSYQGNGLLVSGGSANGSGGTAGGETVSGGQDVTLENFVPVGSYPGGGFPTNVVGIISMRNIQFTNNHDQSVGALFAENDIAYNSNPQGQFAGTWVCKYFDVFNSDSLFYVPELQNHLPFGLPGSQPVIVVTGAQLVDYWQDGS